MANVTAPEVRPPVDGTGPPSSEPRPLPQRVRQASLAAELRVPAEPEEPDGQETWAMPEQAGRSGATIGAFQRQSRRARSGADFGEGLGDGSADSSGEGPGSPSRPGSPRTEERE
jgi:hypothetical protein